MPGRCAGRRSIANGLIFPACLILLLAAGCNLGGGTNATPGGSQPTTEPSYTQPGPTEQGAGLPTVTVGLPAGLIAGDNALVLTHEGLARTYILHIPPAYDGSTPTALVLAFHGIGLDAVEMQRISQFNAQSDQSGFLVVYPEGTGTMRSWNGGHCCGTAARDAVDDVGFVRALIAEISSQLNVDPQQVYATGFSNGAIFTYRLACEMADLLAAVAPVSATQVEDDQRSCSPVRPIPLIHFHGTADTANPYEGGLNQAGFRFLPVAEAMNYWVGVDGCTTLQTSTQGSITHDSHGSCSGGAAVELYTIRDGMHAWPGGEMVNQAMGAPSMEINATTLIWEFFLSHRLQ